MTIELREISKRYGGSVALSSVSLTLEPGRVHALVGENGAGKSTCLKVAGGHVIPTSGSVLVDGAPARMSSGRDGAARGITTIHQELSIIGELTAAQNVFLGAEIRRWGALTDAAAMRRRFVELSRQLGAAIDPDRSAQTLSVSDQQMLEVMKALVRPPRAVLFDEPTAALGPRERDRLYEVIRGLRDDGAVLAFVSHNLDEVLELSDTVSVFRDGRLIGTADTSSWDRPSLTEAMVGRHVAARARPSLTAPADVDPAVRVVDLTGGCLNRVSFELRRGEVVGVAGLVGSGRSTLLRMLAGAQSPESGAVTMGGRAVSWPRTVRAARRLGIALLHEDRKRAGILPEATSRTNMLLGNLAADSTLGVVNPRRADARARRGAAQVGFSTDRMRTPIAALSGGNQQKVLLARILLFRPDVVLADEPARGVDVGAKAEIFDSLHRLADGGSSVLMVSSEFEELEEHCHRVLVLWHGRVVAELTGDQVTRERMIHHSFGPEGPTT